ncbi:MAG: DUF3306 domain-containing protein [Comamonadaceae bacterium]|nr:MAG: DUF3306 domain-containing protein [Comamonadaceae bacterium]
MADGFLSRWAKRKEAVRQGKDVPGEAEKVVVAEPPSPQPSPASGRGSHEALPETAEAPQQVPPPTLEDVRSLTRESDFSRFVQPDVSPEVKNAAMKKLFSDPHFNVMDRLDTYIDDYSQPDPMPPEMLKSLASAKFLKLFEEKDEEEGKAPTGREGADDPGPESVAQSSSRPEQALPPAEDHADPDLRLQQDDAPGPEGPGAGSR